MVNIIAAMRLANAASKHEGAAYLLSDAATLYSIYSQAKSGTFDLHQFANSDELKPTIEAAANLLDIASDLANDPNQLKNIIDLLTSL
jgi:hypothetical protein